MLAYRFPVAYFYAYSWPHQIMNSASYSHNTTTTASSSATDSGAPRLPTGAPQNSTLSAGAQPDPSAPVAPQRAGDLSKYGVDKETSSSSQKDVDDAEGEAECTTDEQSRGQSTAADLKAPIGSKQQQTPQSQQPMASPRNPQAVVPAKLPTPPPHPTPSAKTDSSTPSSSSSSTIDVETNPDYIALTSALSLLLTQRSVACNDLVQLKKLKAEALSNPEKFLAGLRRTGKLPNVPKMQRIVRAPIVSWKTYGIENVHLDHQLARGLVDRTPALTPIRIFDDQN